MARNIRLDPNDNPIFYVQGKAQMYGAGFYAEFDGDGFEVAELSAHAALSSGAEMYLIAGTTALLDAGTSCTIDAGTTCSITAVGNVTVTSGATLGLTGAGKVGINETGTGDTVIGGPTGSGSMKVYAECETLLASGAKYNKSKHTQSGYLSQQDKDRYWNGTSTGVGPTALNGTITPSDAPSNSVIRITTEVLGCDATGTNAYSGTVTATFKKAGATLSLVSSAASNEHKSGGTGTTCAHALSGSTILLNVTGIAATNMRWEAHSTITYGKGF